MKFRRKVLFAGIAVSHILFASNVRAADDPQRASGSEIDAATCRDVVAATDRARKYEANSERYFREIKEFSSYLLGVQAGYGLATNDGKVFGDVHGDALLSWVDYHCRLHPDSSFREAVVALVRDRESRRSKDL